VVHLFDPVAVYTYTQILQFVPFIDILNITDVMWRRCGRRYHRRQLSSPGKAIKETACLAVQCCYCTRASATDCQLYKTLKLRHLNVWSYSYCVTWQIFFRPCCYRHGVITQKAKEVNFHHRG